MNFNVFVNQASIRDRRLIADFSFVSRPLLEVGVNSEGACNRVNTVADSANRPCCPPPPHPPTDLCREVNCLLQTMKNKGSVTVAMTDFQKKKSANSTYMSPLFYTHPHGYHMALLVYANGFDARKGTHVSAAIIVLKGKYDAGLKWPIVGQLTIAMLNQLEDKNHRSDVLNISEKDCVRLGSCWGNRQFTPHSALIHNSAKNIQYLKEDTLYFRVSMEVADRKPWLDCLVQ